MTTRPSLESKIYLCIERHIRIRGMSMIERELFVRRYFENQELANSVMRVLKRKMFQWDMSPLVLFLICNLVKEDEISLLQEESKVFYSIFKLLGKRYMSKESLDWTEEETVEKLAAVGELCFNLLKFNMLIFKRSDLRKWCSSTEDFVVGCGIFRKQLTYNLGQVEESYEPVHKKFVEHLAALHIQFKCDKAKEEQEKMNVLKSVINRYQQQFSTVCVYDFEGTKEIRFKSNILPGSIDALITKYTGETEGDLKIEILPHTEMISKNQSPNDSLSAVSLHVTIYLSIHSRQDSYRPEWIPNEYRDIISHFADEYGRVMCKFTIRRTCMCTMNVMLFKKSEANHLKQFVSFDYSEDNNVCHYCSLSRNPEIVKMFRKAEKHAKQFSIRRSPSQIEDTAQLLSKMTRPNYLTKQHFTRNLTFLGDLKGAAEILSYAVTISGLPKRCYESVETESVEGLLFWVIKSFGYFGRVSSIFYSDIERCQCLRIQYGGIVYSFRKSNAGKLNFFVVNGTDVDSLSNSAMKKLVRAWGSSNVAAERTFFDVNFSCSIKLLSCEIIVSSDGYHGEGSCFDKFTMEKFQI